MKRERPVLVLGGGIAGLTVAEELARNRVRVLLLEKKRQLGGHAARWACMATDRCQRCSSCLVVDTKKRVFENSLIEVTTAGRLQGVAFEGRVIKAQVVPVSENGYLRERGQAGLEGQALHERAIWEVDALFIATGFETFPAEEKPMLHYGELDPVITTEDLDRVILEDRIDSLPVSGTPRPRVAFLQCVGSRDREAGRDYCSQVCCKNSLRLAARLLHEKPEWEITLFYIDLQVFGKGFREFYRTLEGNIRLVQGVPSEVLPVGDKEVSLVFEEPKTGDLKTETFGLVVLAVGMLPPKDALELSRLLQAPLERRGFFEKLHDGNGSGIYTVGACRAPTDILGARRQAMEAAGHYLAKRGSGCGERVTEHDG